VLLSALPALIYIGLVVYSVLDCLQTPGDELSRLTRGQWVTVILVLPLGGALAWLFVGRRGAAGPAGRHERVRSGPNRAAGYGWTAEGAAQHPIGPDDDLEFLAGLGRAQAERQRLLTRQEEDRRRREAQRENQRRHENGEPEEPDGTA
jgi:hypothetical protein